MEKRDAGDSARVGPGEGLRREDVESARNLSRIEGAYGFFDRGLAGETLRGGAGGFRELAEAIFRGRGARSRFPIANLAKRRRARTEGASLAFERAKPERSGSAEKKSEGRPPLRARRDAEEIDEARERECEEGRGRNGVEKAEVEGQVRECRGEQRRGDES